MHRLLLVLLGAATLAACGTGEVMPDGGMADDVDASAAPGGLVFQFSAPEVDQQLGDVRIDRLRLRLTNLRANGDAGPSLDTYRDEEDLDLKDPSVREVRFDRAPPGRYSAFEFGLERYSDSEAAWELEGRVDVDNDTRDFRVEDEETSTVSLPLDLDLAPGETVEVSLTVDLDLLATTIDWDLAPIDNGDVVIDGDSPFLLAAARAALLAAFAVASITPGR